MLLTLIIPFYNRADFLPRTLRSLDAVNLRGVELLLVDDGSTDASATLCRDYLSKRVARGEETGEARLISMSHAGASAARNAGLRQARGQWVYFFDSDDTLSPDFFTDALQVLAPQPEALDVLACVNTLQLPDGTRMQRYSRCSASLADQLLTVPLCTQSMMLRTDFLRRIGGWNEALTIWLDWELGVRALLHGARVSWMRGKTYHTIYRHAASITGSGFAPAYNRIAVTLHCVWQQLLAMPAAASAAVPTPAPLLLPSTASFHLTLPMRPADSRCRCLVAYALRTAIVAGTLRRERAAEASLNLLRTTRQAIATHLHVLHRALVGATLTAIYHYVRLGGRGAWLLPRLLLLPFIR